MTTLAQTTFLASPRARAYAKRIGISLDSIEGSGPNGRIIEEDVIYFTKDITSPFTDHSPQRSHQKKITPLAKSISRIEKKDYEHIQGSGMNGKIVSADILKELKQQNVHSDKKKVLLSGIRKIIATRMSNSKQNAPHVTLTVKTEVSNLVNYRKLLIEKYNRKISYTDLLIKIVAEGMSRHPKIIVSLEDEMLTYHSDINIGVAVALDEGLVVPVIHNADQKSVDQLSADVEDRVNKARTGKLKAADMENGRFTISNLGMYQVDGFTPVINPPESAILGVGRMIEDIIVENSQIRIGKTMMLSLSFDHRVMDGAPAAEFLGIIKHFIENPEEIMSLQK